jgi:radical SAM protein with 4Fe4S-binding SPASM domain
MDIIERIVELRPMGVSITGGEPLLVRNLREVLEYLFEHFSNGIGLATNATLINEENVVWLCELVSSFDISIDGINSATCDAIRGAGTFDKVISAIKLIKKHTNKEIILSMVTDNETDKNSDAFIAMCKELDVTPRIRTMNLVGRAKDNHIDSDEIVEFMRASTANLVASYDCPGGTKELFVNSKGDVYPCPLFAENEYKVGTIFDRDLTEKLTWNKQLDWFKAFSEYIPDTRTECETCEVRSFCWNCPALAKSYMENNEIAALRSICADKQRALHEVLWNA